MTDLRTTRAGLPGAPTPSTRRSFGAEHEHFASDFSRVRTAATRGDVTVGMTMGRLVRRLRRHMRVEEGFLLAPLEERLGASDLSLTATVRREHELLDGLIDRAADAISEGGGAGIVELDALERALLDNEWTEEQLLFPLCDDLLPAEQRIAAVRELDPKDLRPAEYAWARVMILAPSPPG